MPRPCYECISRHLAIFSGDFERMLFDDSVRCSHIDYPETIDAADTLHQCRNPRLCLTPAPHYRGQCVIPNDEKKGSTL